MLTKSAQRTGSYLCEVEYYNGAQTTILVEIVEAPKPEMAAERAEWVAASKAGRTFVLHRFFCRKVQALAAA